MDIRIFYLAPLACIFLLAGCVDDSASYEIGARDHALSLIREQRYLWEDEVELSLVVTRLPDCQRRHSLENTMTGDMKIQLYETESQLFLLRHGKNWYSVDADACLVELIEPPKQGAQGTLRGTFEQHGAEKFAFVVVEASQQR